MPAAPKKPSKLSRMRRRLKARDSCIPAIVLAVILLAVSVPVYKLYSKVNPNTQPMIDSDEAEQLPFYRDLFTQEAWPGVEWNYSEPKQNHHTVHYLWCGQKTFRFKDYLALLSVLRILQPLRFVFRYTDLPVLDDRWYHTWFYELKQSLPNLELRRLHLDATNGAACGSVDMLRVALGLLSETGGIFVGEGVTLTKSFNHLNNLPFWFAFTDLQRDATSGVVYVNRGFNEHTLEDYVQVITSNDPHCISLEEYERLELVDENLSLCLGLVEDLYPRDIRSLESPFGELARWLFYGKRKPFFTRHSTLENVAPRISHYTWMSSGDPLDSPEFTFAHYISVLSALHMAGMEHVYVHGDVKPRGIWWDELALENVTFLYVDLPETIFQQPVNVPAHASDVVRYSVLYKYGGVYQDTDVIWVNSLPEWLQGYPAVAGPDWPHYGEWPDSLNLGVIVAQRQAPFLRHVLSTYRYFRDDDWNFNAVLMPYRVYEWHPDTLYQDVYLQAICTDETCHHPWADDDDITSNNDDSKLQSVRALHFRQPKIPASLSGPLALTSGSDMYAELGRQVLERSRRLDLLDAAQS